MDPTAVLFSIKWVWLTYVPDKFMCITAAERGVQSNPPNPPCVRAWYGLYQVSVEAAEKGVRSNPPNPGPGMGYINSRMVFGCPSTIIVQAGVQNHS